jgi:hypothetical protein
MMRWAVRLVRAFPPVLLLSCGPAEPAKTSGPAPTAIAAATVAPTAAPTVKPTHEPPATAAPISTTGDPPPAAAGDYTITFTDCDKLVGNYERVLRQSEMAKLDAKKLPAKNYDKAKEQVEEVVQQGVAVWRGQCQSITGTVQVRSRIKCAVAAGDLDRFNGCWDGKFDKE